MKITLILAMSIALFGSSAWAMKIDSKTLRSRAFSKKLPNGIFASLDLKQKNIRFTKGDLQKCKSTTKRTKGTLKYSCTLALPTKSSTSILNKVRTPQKIAVHHGKLIKMVNVKFGDDGRSVTFTTEFDNSAIDFEFAEFNSEVFNIFDEAAGQVIAKAMLRNRMLITTLEN